MNWLNPVSEQKNGEKCGFHGCNLGVVDVAEVSISSVDFKPGEVCNNVCCPLYHRRLDFVFVMLELLMCL